MKSWTRLIALFSLAALVLMPIACNTVKGVADDLRGGAEATERAIRGSDTKPSDPAK